MVHHLQGFGKVAPAQVSSRPWRSLTRRCRNAKWVRVPPTWCCWRRALGGQAAPPTLAHLLRAAECQDHLLGNFATEVLRRAGSRSHPLQERTLNAQQLKIRKLEGSETPQTCLSLGSLVTSPGSPWVGEAAGLEVEGSEWGERYFPP